MTNATTAIGRMNGRARRISSSSGSFATLSPAVLEVHEVDPASAADDETDPGEDVLDPEKPVDQISDRPPRQHPPEECRDDRVSNSHAGPGIVALGPRHGSESIAMPTRGRQAELEPPLVGAGTGSRSL